MGGPRLEHHFVTGDEDVNSCKLSVFVYYCIFDQKVFMNGTNRSKASLV